MDFYEREMWQMYRKQLKIISCQQPHIHTRNHFCLCLAFIVTTLKIYSKTTFDQRHFPSAANIHCANMEGKHIHRQNDAPPKSHVHFSSHTEANVPPSPYTKHRMTPPCHAQRQCIYPNHNTTNPEYSPQKNKLRGYGRRNGRLGLDKVLRCR